MDSKCKGCKGVIQEKDKAVLVAYGNAEFDKSGVYDGFTHKETYLYHKKCYKGG